MSLNWCIFSIQRLRDYEARKEAIDSLTEQISLLEDKFTAIRSATTDSTPVQGGNENRREQMLIHNIATREELQKNLELTKNEVEITEKGLAALTETERRILTRFYINRTKGYVERLCDELYISKTELYRQKEDALKRFTTVCYGIVEL
jgi:ArpU family phage transcriptional regulator